MSDRELEVRRAEQEATELELQLRSEAGRLEGKSAELLGRLQQLRASASQQQLLGARDQRFVEMHERIQHATVPGVEIEAPRERAVRARLHAVSERMDAASEVRAAVHAFADELTALAAQLARDEETLARTQEAVAEELARRAAEEERRAAEAQRLAAEMQRRAAEPPPVDRERKTTQIEMQIAKTESPPPRKRVRVKMQAAIDLESDSNFYTGFSTNISEGGIFVATVNMPPRGAMVELHFSLPNGKRMDVRGEVRWSREVNDKTPDIFPGVGVQFLDLSADAHADIRNFVAEREPMFFPD